jgi:hypothetical protein
MQTVRTLERERQLTVLGDTLFEGWQMKRMRRVAIISTTFSMFDLFFILNTWLVLPAVAPNGTRPPCFPVLDVPFTNYSFRLPLWMWAIQFWVFALSTLAAITLWIVALFQWRAKIRKAAPMSQSAT